MTLCFILSCSVFNVLSLVSLVECPFILPSSLPFVKLFLVLFLFFSLFPSFSAFISLFFIPLFFYLFPFFEQYTAFLHEKRPFSGLLIINYNLINFALYLLLFIFFYFL